MKIKLSKSQWEGIGKKAGWIKSAASQEDIIKQEILSYPNHFVLKAIKSLGEESIAGFSNVTMDDIEDVLAMCELYELGEILNVCKKYSKRLETQPELPFK
jgi:hypothetical protein